MKYAIVCQLTIDDPFADVVKQLSLNEEEVNALLGLISKERKKISRLNHLSGMRLDICGTHCAAKTLIPITEGISASEVCRGRSFLKSLCLTNVVGNLGRWQGTGGSFHEIPVEEPSQQPAPGITQGAVDGPKRSLPTITGVPLMDLLDPPANTLNPHRLKHGLPPTRAPGMNVPVVVPHLKGDLHPGNYLFHSDSGQYYCIWDETPWPEWLALYSAGIISREMLNVLTVGSAVPNNVPFMSEEELAAPQFNTAASFGSAHVPVDRLDYSTNYLPQPYDLVLNDSGRLDP